MMMFNESRLISGTFLQLDHHCDREGARFQRELRSLTAEDWHRMVHDMAAIGIDTLIFQQCIDCRHGWDEPQAYYPSGRLPQPEWMREDLFGAVVEAADALGMKIFYGLGATRSADPYLRIGEVIERMKLICSELLELYGERRSFAGWYWTYEYPPGVPAGRDSLRKIVPAVRQLSDAPLMIAPCAETLMTPVLLEDIDVDIVAYQDCVGLGVEPDMFGRFSRADRVQSLERLPFLYKLLRRAHDGWAPETTEKVDYWTAYFRSRGRTAIWNDVEIWEFDGRGALVPTELSRLVAQLELTAPFVEKQLIYQYPGLMHHPDHPVHVGGERAATLYMDYAAYRDARLTRERT